MARPPRFFISPEQVSEPQIIVSGEDVRHIVNVLRRKAGDELLLCDGQGTDYTVKITRIERSEIATEIISRRERKSRYPLITLGQGLPKADKMDFIIQKATELGVFAVVPVVTERTIVKIRDEAKKISRWRKIAREAAMQSNRADIPQVGRVVSFEEFLRTSALDPGALLLLPWEEGTGSIKSILGQNPGVERIVVLVGPEGGFSVAEAAAAKSGGFHPVSLGPNILRAETAAIAVLSMIIYEYHWFVP